MPLLAAHFTRGEAFSLLRDDMNETRALHRANGFQRIDHPAEIVTVDGTEIPKAELLEQYTRCEEGLDALLPLPHQAAHRCPATRRVIDELTDRRTQAIVQRVALDRR